ncbi:MAG: hypothetical protein ABII82_01560 [Verrucomicrobiota bacterium]
MPHAVIEKLLILQDRDTRRINLEKQLAAVPAEIAAVEAAIAAEKAAIETARGEMKGLESNKKVLETEIRSAEGKLAKYRTQQSQVKKNDEYQALGHEIETMEAAIGVLEEQEIELLYKIDEAKKRFNAAEASLKANIDGHQARIATLRERAANLTAELAEANAALASAREPVSEPGLRVYDRVAARQQPVIVAVRAGKCDGCHLKVSSEVESESRSRDETKLATCDQCGRVVYWDS